MLILCCFRFEVFENPFGDDRPVIKVWIIRGPELTSIVADARLKIGVCSAICLGCERDAVMRQALLCLIPQVFAAEKLILLWPIVFDVRLVATIIILTLIFLAVESIVGHTDTASIDGLTCDLFADLMVLAWASDHKMSHESGEKAREVPSDCSHFWMLVCAVLVDAAICPLSVGDALVDDIFQIVSEDLKVLPGQYTLAATVPVRLCEVLDLSLGVFASNVTTDGLASFVRSFRQTRIEVAFVALLASDQ